MSMTIAEVLRQLRTANSDATVHFAFGHLKPTTVNSWRGIYSEAALGWSADSPAPSVRELCKELEGAIEGRVFHGWKGGEYRFDGNTELHIDCPGHCSDTEISRIEITDTMVILHTANEPENDTAFDCVRVEDRTVFVLNERGVNRWWASVQPGQDDNGERIADDECRRIARSIAARLPSLSAGVVDSGPPTEQSVELTEDQASAPDAAFARMRKERDALKKRLFEALDSDPILKEGLDEVDHALHINRMTYSRVLDVACAQKARADEAEAKLAALSSPAAPAVEPPAELTTCNCRWKGDVLVQQCTLHDAWRDSIHEWAERAKTAERKLAIATAAPSPQPEQSAAPRWKSGNEFAPFHPQASHVSPDYRDGWNACYRASVAAPAAPQVVQGEVEREALRFFFERNATFVGATIVLDFETHGEAFKALTAARAALASATPPAEPADYSLTQAQVDEILSLLEETYRFATTSPRAQENINAVCELLNGAANAK